MFKMQFFLIRPSSLSITAVWDQNGGFMCDRYGNITKEWSWQTNRSLKIIIQVKTFENFSTFSVSYIQFYILCVYK